MVEGGGLTTGLGEVEKLVLYSHGCLVVRVLVRVLVSPRLQRSEEHRQAEVASPASSDTWRGRHWSSTSRGFSTLPNKVPLGRHSLMTESDPSACCRE